MIRQPNPRREYTKATRYNFAKSFAEVAGMSVRSFTGALCWSTVLSTVSWGAAPSPVADAAIWSLAASRRSGPSTWRERSKSEFEIRRRSGRTPTFDFGERI